MVVLVEGTEVDLGSRNGTDSCAAWILRSITLVHPKTPSPILLLKNFRNTSTGKVAGKRACVELDQTTITMIFIAVEILRI